MSTERVYFVYLGSKLPSYVPFALNLSAEMSGLEVKILASGALKNAFDDPNMYIPIEDFYDKSIFQAASNRISSSHDFRQGFWLKSLERFFVLEQFMKRKNIVSVFHAELDQLLFGVDILVEALANSGKKGLFYPFHTDQAAIASMFYCNDLNELSKMIAFATSGEIFPNEMKLLASWAKQENSTVYALPTLAGAFSPKRIARFGEFVSTIEVTKTKGYVDPAQLGQWIAGIDPRNVDVKKRPYTLFVDSPHDLILSHSELATCHFEFDRKKSALICTRDKKEFRIFNLHLHSKIHKWLAKNPDNLERLFYFANAGKEFSIPGTKRVQITNFVSLHWELIRKNPEKIVYYLRRKFFKVFCKYSDSYPLITVDYFKNLAGIQITSDQKIRLTDNCIDQTIIVFCSSKSLECLPSVLSKYVNVQVRIIIYRDITDDSLNLLKALEGISSAHSRIFLLGFHDYISGTEYLPVGIENYSKGNYLKRHYLPNYSEKNFRNREHLIFWQHSQFDYSARDLESVGVLANLPTAKLHGWMSSKDVRISLERYAFMAVFIDDNDAFYRVWESMYLGCVPIIQSSFASDRLLKLNLPIWVVDSFRELENHDVEFLRIKYKEIITLSSRDALHADFWKKEILR